MNAPIARLFGVVIVLFALLVVFTSRWTVFEASSLNNNTLNVRTLLDELHIKRGRILAADGTGPGGLGLDSIDALELVVSLEKKFGVSVANSETARQALASVNTIHDYVVANRK